jgi:hypothetical protein
MRMIIDPLASTRAELIPLFGVCYSARNNATPGDRDASNQQVFPPKTVTISTLVAETTFAIIKQL